MNPIINHKLSFYNHSFKKKKKERKKKNKEITCKGPNLPKYSLNSLSPTSGANPPTNIFLDSCLFIHKMKKKENKKKKEEEEWLVNICSKFFHKNNWQLTINITTYQ